MLLKGGANDFADENLLCFSQSALLADGV
jgi:hypothetical protein